MTHNSSGQVTFLVVIQHAVKNLKISKMLLVVGCFTVSVANPFDKKGSLDKRICLMHKCKYTYRVCVCIQRMENIESYVKL